MFQKMKIISAVCLMLLIASTNKAFGQNDSINIPKADTTRRVFSATVTITEIMDSAFQMHYDTLIVENDHPVYWNHNKLQTNWLIFDLGFANFDDKTPYGSTAANEYLQGGAGGPFTKSDMRLRTVKSSNVNIWLFMQKFSLYKNKLNLKYGLGLEMFNFRYENDITYHKNRTISTVIPFPFRRTNYTQAMLLFHSC